LLCALTQSLVMGKNGGSARTRTTVLDVERKKKKGWQLKKLGAREIPRLLRQIEYFHERRGQGGTGRFVPGQERKGTETLGESKRSREKTL